MPVHISRSQLARLRHGASSLSRRVGALRGKTESAVRQAVTLAEVGITSFGFGIVHGRYGAVDVVGVPVDLGLAVLLHGAGFFGLGGKYSHHLHGFANGALASYFVGLGTGVGLEMKKKALGAAVTGAKGHRLTQAELEAMAR